VGAAAPERRLFGSLTRPALLRYYEELAPVIVPHLRGRAFVSVLGARPGVRGRYLKDVPAGAPAWLPRAALPAVSRGGAPVVAPVVDDPAALLWLVQRGVVELHATLHRIDDVTRPDQVLFDLDPTPGVRIADTARVALLVRDALSGLSLRSCVKTSGRAGLHVAVPIARGPDYAATRAFARTVAVALEHALPGLVSHRIGDRRSRRVVVDWRQNQTGASIAAPYSVRARRGAPVSCPIAWEELEEGVRPSAFRMDAARERVAAHGDLYALALAGGQQLPRASAR
jgi:bifunctional non-homologous end joining protein LigD